MNVTQQGIITLLKSAVMEESLPLPQEFHLEDAGGIVTQNHIDTLVYDGALRCGISPGDPLMEKLFERYYRMALISSAQMERVEAICAAFEEHGISHMPLKGCKMKRLYPKPELRTMGDADILIRMDQYEKIIPIMESLGFREGVRSAHELVWESKALYLELHKRLVSPEETDLYGYFGDGWSLAVQDEGSRYTMTAEDEFLFAFAHFTKHYRNGGIGCLHVLDLWMYLRNHPDLNETHVREVLKKLDLLEFYENIRKLIRVWFEDMPTDEKMDYLTEYVFSGGVWGSMETYFVSRAVHDAKRSSGGGNSRLGYIRRALYPGKDVMEGEYPCVRKNPYLLPVMCVVRICSKLADRNTVRRQKENMSVLTPEKIQSWRDALDYVGLRG